MNNAFKHIKTYLIQPAEKNQWDDDCIGIDRLLSFLYMGASEYEWGALPRSLKRIRSKKEELELKEYDWKGIPLMLLAKPEIHSEFLPWLKPLSEYKYRLKCGIAFNEVGKNDNILWWSIDQDFMFWMKDEVDQEVFLNELFPV